MMKIKNFTEIDAWKEARILTREIYLITNKTNFSRDFGLKDQIRRAACSIMANIAEGFGCYSNSEFIRYLVISRRSCSELDSHLYIGLDQKYISQDEFDNLIKQSSKVAQLINGFIRYLRTNQRANELTNKRTNGFTFIELLITWAVIAICFLPLMRMFSASLEQVYVTNDLTVARYLAQEGMEKVKNLGFTEAQFEDLGDIWEPALDKPPLELNNRYWRVFRKIVKGTDPLEIRIQVYQLSAISYQLSEKPIVEVVTLVEDLDWNPVE